MKTKLMVMAIAALSIAAFSAPTASAADCGEQTSQARDYSGTPETNPNYGKPTGTDKLADTTPGGQLYGSASQSSMSGYIGTTGNAGFLDASGSQAAGGVTVQGYQTNSGVNGKATVGTDPSVCLQDTHLVP